MLKKLQKTIGLNLILFSIFSIFSSTGITLNKHYDPLSRIKVTPVDEISEAIPSFTSNVSDEPSYSSEIQFNNINIGNTWDNFRGQGVTVAVIDSGINITHEDFFDSSNNITISNKSASLLYNSTSGSVITTQVTNNDYSTISDSGNHGTNVAGTIAARVNGVGTSGVAPEVSLMILKTAYVTTEVNAAIRYAADNGANIINMSFVLYEVSFTNYLNQSVTGYSGASSFFSSAINYAYGKGVTIIAAAGNDGTSNSAYPASNTHVIGVGALARNSGSSMASYSNSGTSNVKLVAPGSVYVPTTGSSSSYIETQGTSFASPIVAAAAAIYKSRQTSATNAQIETRLESTAYDLGTTGNDATYGYGRLDISSLVGNPIISISLDKSELAMKVGDTATLIATVTPSNADDPTYGFISNDENIATVDMESGLITALAIGSTTIGVFSNDRNLDAYCTVNVSSSGSALEDAISWATSFLDSTATECQNLNVTSTTWNALKETYLALSSDAKNEFVNNSSLNTTITSAQARYRFIILKYIEFDNFVVDGNSNVYVTRNANSIYKNIASNDSWIIIIITISVSIGAIFIFSCIAIRNKKKED